jgi:hypothetical protein
MKNNTKSVLDGSTRNELITRIESLHAASARGWGKMSLPQMMEHCIRCEQTYFGDLKIPRSFLGRLIGNPVLKKMLSEGGGMGRNAPTSSRLIIPGTGGDIEAQKQHWIRYIRRYSNFPAGNYTHWFFGKMTPDQVGRFVYMHDDHHLRQFGA